jgi:catechol 2,3-dioxygenase-like lactoylglutathione lyase family enzyme
MSLTSPRGRRLNHVSVPARDLDESEAFYVAAFGMVRIPAPNFGFPVRWLRLGDAQLHLQQIGLDGALSGRTYQHFGIEVDDFVATFRALERLEAFAAERDTRYGAIWLLPSGEVQMFLRDPSDNLVEVDWPDASTLDLAIFGDRVRVLAEEEEQGPEQVRATLFLGS